MQITKILSKNLGRQAPHFQIVYDFAEGILIIFMFSQFFMYFSNMNILEPLKWYNTTIFEVKDGVNTVIFRSFFSKDFQRSIFADILPIFGPYLHEITSQKITVPDQLCTKNMSY